MTQSTPQPVAIITGAARGIGLASANWFLARAYRAVLIDNDEASLAATAKAMPASAPVMSIVCDVSDPVQVQAAINQVQAQFGRADALVNNAGVTIFKPIENTSFSE
jgi:meso-butanediol dehydrogenase / (S,S)-butanediol dehydrogenase / diacetyl reductase